MFSCFTSDMKIYMFAGMYNIVIVFLKLTSLLMCVKLIKAYNLHLAEHGHFDWQVVSDISFNMTH